jgi:hypothetical protein
MKRFLAVLRIGFVTLTTEAVQFDSDAATYNRRGLEWSEKKEFDRAIKESGDFEKAVKYQKQAIEDKDAEKEILDKRRLRLKLFERKKPYHEP